jgi:hypothetical protein
VCTVVQTHSIGELIQAYRALVHGFEEVNFEVAFNRCMILSHIMHNNEITQCAQLFDRLLRRCFSAEVTVNYSDTLQTIFTLQLGQTSFNWTVIHPDPLIPTTLLLTAAEYAGDSVNVSMSVVISTTACYIEFGCPGAPVFHRLVYVYYPILRSEIESLVRMIRLSFVPAPCYSCAPVFQEFLRRRIPPNGSPSRVIVPVVPGEGLPLPPPPPPVTAS